MALTVRAIVCAVDFSAFSPSVVGHGVALARRTGWPLYLFHAVHNPQDGVHPTAVFERGGELHHHQTDARRRMHDLMIDVPVKWEAVIRVGDPVEQTLAFVRDLPPCLVISASHGVSGLRRLFIGTVVERLTRALEHPMLVVKSAERGGDVRRSGFRSAVVSCDGHGHWRRMMPLLALLQRDAASRIHLVHAMEGPLEATQADLETASYTEVQQVLQERLAQQYRRQVRAFFPEDHRLSVVVAPGVPEEMVMSVAQQEASELIVVGVRRSGRMGRLISGSTTEALLRHAPCCVLAFPEPEKTPSTPGASR